MNLSYLLLAAIFAPVARTLIVTLHELGHAIPAILFTKKKASIFIGSYIDSEKDMHFEIGLLEVSINYKVFWLKNGFCRASTQDMSEKQQLIHILCGPVFPVLFSVALYIFTLRFESPFSQELYSTYIMIFMLATVLDLFINLIPSSTPIDMGNGVEVYNDGENIRRLLDSDSTDAEYNEADAKPNEVYVDPDDVDAKLKLALLYFNRNEYAHSIALLDELIEKKAFLDAVYRFNIKVNLTAGDYEKAKRLLDKFIEEFPDYQFDANDYNIRGVVYQKIGAEDQSMECFDKAIELDPNDVCALINKGHILSGYCRYEEAIPFFDRAIEQEKSVASIYNQRALAKIKAGKGDEAYPDIREAMNLEPDSAYAVQNLGIYHLDRGESDKALQFFLKAKELNPNVEILGIEELILEAERMKGSMGND